MKLQLNKEYVLRHLGVALVMLGVSGWSAYDGFVGYPKQNCLWEQRTGGDVIEAFKAADAARKRGEVVDPATLPPYSQGKVDGQFYQALILAFISLFIATRVSLESLRTFDFAKDDVDSVDYSKWAKKRLAYVVLKNGKRVVVDGWHYVGVPAFLDSLGFPVPA